MIILRATVKSVIHTPSRTNNRTGEVYDESFQLQLEHQDTYGKYIIETMYLPSKAYYDQYTPQIGKMAHVPIRPTVSDGKLRIYFDDRLLPSEKKAV